MAAQMIKIKFIRIALLIVVLGAILILPRTALARTYSLRVGCGPSNEWYGISGTQDASGAYIGPVTLSMGSNCPWVVVLKFIVDGQLVYDPAKSYGEYYTISSGGAHTITFFFDTGGGGQTYGPFFATINIDQPPIIAASMMCSQPGQAGWCVGSETLELTASDPQGKPVLISGDVAGTAFACPSGNTTCSIPLPNGSGTINYLVTSQTTLTASGSTSWSLDNDTPQINGALNGSSGTNNWFVSNVLLSASASDVTSGVSQLEYSYDAVNQTPYTAPITLSDGIYNITLRAMDNAGNQNEVAQYIKVDSVTPTLNLSLNGTTGLSGWYKSNVQVTVSGNDSGSGLAGIAYSVDGGASTSYIGALTLTDGAHNLSVRAMDAAGNVTQTDQQVHVDTLTPLINLSVNGTTGTDNWYTSDIKVNASSLDSGSGLASFEYSLNGGAWTAYVSALPYSEGQASLNFRAIDQAGNTTITPAQLFLVDKTAPVIKMSNAWNLGSTEKYKISDSGSGVSGVHVVIHDDKDKYPKVVWDDGDLVPYFVGDIFWDGRFRDGTVAPSGDYFVTLKAYDQAGNESVQTSVITVENSLLTYLIPPSVPVRHPTATLPTMPAPSNDSNFGGENNTDPVDSQAGIISTGGVLTSSTGTSGSTDFNTQSTDSKTTKSQSNNILWGTLAAAAVGAFTAEALAMRRKEQEEAQQALVEKLKKQQEEVEAAEKTELAAKAALRVARFAGDDGGGMSYKQIGQAYQAALQEQKEREKNQQAVQNVRTERKEALIEEQTKAFTAKPQDWKTDYDKYMSQKTDSARWTGLASQEKGMKDIQETNLAQSKKWWQKGLDWVDQHQIEIALGIGIAVGVGAIILSGGVAAPLVAAAWIAGSAFMAGTTVALGTVGLNAYYSREWNENLLRNIAVAGVAAAAVTGVAFLFQAATSGVATYCTVHPDTCALAGPAFKALDTVEETWLNAKLTYQTWRGDGPGAAETALQLQMEYLDGGMPGNTAAKEISGDALEIVEIYGDDAAELIAKYGDDAVDIIGAYGDDGIALLLKFGDKTDDAIALVKEFGTPAVKVLDTVDLTSAKTLLTTLDAGSLDYAIEQGPGAVKALSYWPDSFLIKYGDELILRSNDDARALEAASKLVKLKNLNTKEAQDLIDTIAYNSIQGGGNRLVLGKWVNNGTLDNGFIGVARADGALFYGTNPGLEKILSETTDLPQEDLFWAINNRVLDISVAHDFKIDYSLDGIDPDSIQREISAIKAIASKKSQEDVAKIMGGSFPFRFKEVKALVDQGYIFEIDKVANVIHWIKP